MGMTTGLVSFALCTVMLGVACGLVLCQAEIARLLRGAAPPEAPPNPRPDRPSRTPLAPFAGCAARCWRRLPARPMARRRGTTAAYDDLLVHAARALGVPDTLTGLPEGTDREAERLRVEHLLAQAGLRLD